MNTVLKKVIVNTITNIQKSKTFVTIIKMEFNYNFTTLERILKVYFLIL